MKQSSVEQSLSALMDGEASELEVQRILRDVEQPELRERWQRMHEARWAMHQESIVGGIDLTAGIRAALDAVEQDKADTAQSRQPGLWARWSKVAVAASVTLAVLAGARIYNDTGLTETAPVMAGSQKLPALTPSASGTPLVLASYDSNPQQTIFSQADESTSQWYRERLPAYLQQHNSYTNNPGVPGYLPYARSASIQE